MYVGQIILISLSSQCLMFWTNSNLQGTYVHAGFFQDLNGPMCRYICSVHVYNGITWFTVQSTSAINSESLQIRPSCSDISLFAILYKFLSVIMFS